MEQMQKVAQETNTIQNYKLNPSSIAIKKSCIFSNINIYSACCDENVVVYSHLRVCNFSNCQINVCLCDIFCLHLIACYYVVIIYKSNFQITKCTCLQIGGIVSK